MRELKRISVSFLFVDIARMLQFNTIYTGVDVSIVRFVYSLSMAWIY